MSTEVMSHSPEGKPDHETFFPIPQLKPAGCAMEVLPVGRPRMQRPDRYQVAIRMLALAGLTKALADEWASKNIHVNAIAPGYMDTEMCEAIINDPIRGPKIRERIPAGRWGTPEDPVGPLLFL